MLPTGRCDHEKRRMVLLWGFTIITIAMLLMIIVAISLIPSTRVLHHTTTVLHLVTIIRGTTTVTTTTAAAFDYSSACNTTTFYPEACATAFAAVSATKQPKTPKDAFDVSVQFAMHHAHSARSLAYNLSLPDHRHRDSSSTASPPTGAHDCFELLDDTLEHLARALDAPTEEDAETWLSAALTNQATCAESLRTNPPETGRGKVEAQARSLSKFISNSLAIHKATMRRRYKKKKKTSATGGLPRWVTGEDRRLLGVPVEEIEADAVVAADGNGTHRSIGEALAFVALAKGSGNGGGGGGGRSVIYVKAGVYHEYIRVLTKQKNVMLVGDGKGKSVIVGSRSKRDGWSTYQSATVAGMGAGFIARDLTIVNNAGPSKEQAVALRVGADKAVIHRCSIEGYQDTLYAHSNRQFYRDTDVYGTVDFVFGNAAAVFQNCNLSPRKPNPGHRNSVTAQGRLDPNQNTGFSIQGCRVACAPDLAGTVETFLGRPWHKYSRVVVMQSYVDACISPAGWEPWSVGFALSTLYYGEYWNTGPGASTARRVRWPGVHVTMSSAEAWKFTASQFIAGNTWLPGTGVNYKAGL